MYAEIIAYSILAVIFISSMITGTYIGKWCVRCIRKRAEKNKLKVGDKIKLHPKCIEKYLEEFRGVVFTITGITTNKKENITCENGDDCLYILQDKSNKKFPFLVREHGMDRIK